MKKVLCVMILGAAVLGGAYSLDLPPVVLSAGGGGLFTFDPAGGAKKDSNELTITSFGGGGYGFFDATYGQVTVAFTGGALNQEAKISIPGLGSGSFKSEGSYMALSFGAFGKFPFALSPQLSLYPLLGVEYQMYLSAKEKWAAPIGDNKERNVAKMTDRTKDADLNNFWVRLGGGVDFSFTEALYLRGEIMYGLRMANSYEDDIKKEFSGDTILGHGGAVRIAVGYRFMVL